jgi:hypothetical protein
VNTRDVGPAVGCDRPRYDATPRQGVLVADLVFVGITVVLFAALTVVIRAVERW